jgi:hypothetical protein
MVNIRFPAAIGTLAAGIAATDSCGKPGISSVNEFLSKRFNFFSNELKKPKRLFNPC